MAEKQAGYVDEIGVPLPILPLGQSRTRNELDEHHPFYDKKRAELQTEGGKVLRYSRVQSLPRFLHEAYHEAFSEIEITTDPASQFTLLVMIHAGYIPEESVDFRSSSAPKRVYIPHVLRRRFYEDTIYPDNAPIGLDGQHYKRRATGLFMARYAIYQELEKDRLSTVEEFLHELTSENRKRELGQILISQLIEEAVGPIVPLHKEALSRLCLPEDAPKHPFGVVRMVFTKCYDNDYMALLQERMAFVLQNAA